MYAQMDESIHAEEISFPKATIVNGELKFDGPTGFDYSIKEGVFFLKIPEDFNIESGVKFSENFYKQPTSDSLNNYKGYHLLKYEDSILGYSDRHDQVEQLQLELSLWEKYFPADLATLLKKMNDLGLYIIEQVFEKCRIKREYWDTITGGASKGTALQYCIFNHYRQLERESGITKHKDSGYVTVLYSPEPGLEAWINNKWYAINPPAGYFTINLGHSFEVLTSQLEHPIHAVDHRVRQIIKENGEPDRFSFGTYIGPRFDMDLFQYDQNDKLNFYQKFIDFQKIKAKQMGYEFHPRVKAGGE